MDKTTELFCLIDDFCQQFEPLLVQRMLDSSDKQRRNRPGEMSLSEITTIAVLFHTMRGRQFKEFYRGIVCRFMTAEFPRRLSYTRFVALMPRCAVVLAALFETLKGTCTSLSIADATPLAVCHNLRIERHRVFKASPSAANRLPAGFMASSCMRLSTTGASCWPSGSRRAMWMTEKACWPSPQACLASCKPTRATLARSLRKR